MKINLEEFARKFCDQKIKLLSVKSEYSKYEFIIVGYNDKASFPGILLHGIRFFPKKFFTSLENDVLLTSNKMFSPNICWNFQDREFLCFTGNKEVDIYLFPYIVSNRENM